MNTVLGIYGAVLSSILAATKIVEFCRDRARVKVQFEANVLANLEGYPGEYSLITVVNLGRRPETISVIGLEYADGSTHYPPLRFCSPALPVTLEESKNVAGFIPREAVQFDKLRWAFAKISGGRIYKSRRYKRV
jgi:hypothetical protein